MTFIKDIFFKTRHITLYGLIMAIFVFALKWFQWKFLVLDNATEIYAGLIAISFTLLGIWVATQVFMVAMPDLGPIAWWAHIGGLIAGAVLIVFMRRPGVPLFDRGAKLA